MSRFSMDKNSKKYLIIAAVVLILVVYLVVLIGKIRTKKELDAQHNQMESAVTSILEDNSRVKESIEHGEDESYIEEIARNEYSYVNPEERVYYDNDAS